MPDTEGWHAEHKLCCSLSFVMVPVLLGTVLPFVKKKNGSLVLFLLTLLGLHFCSSLGPHLGSRRTLCSNVVTASLSSLDALESLLDQNFEQQLFSLHALRQTLPFSALDLPRTQPGASALAQHIVCAALLICPPAPAAKMANVQMYYDPIVL